MPKKTDARGMLKEEPFAYTETKNGKVFVSWQGKQVVTLQGADATRFLQRMNGADPNQAQLIMAKCTGNFKRGNEKAAKRK